MRRRGLCVDPDGHGHLIGEVGSAGNEATSRGETLFSQQVSETPPLPSPPLPSSLPLSCQLAFTSPPSPSYPPPAPLASCLLLS